MFLHFWLTSNWEVISSPTLQVEFRVPINGLINTYKFHWREISPPISGVDFAGGAVVVHRSFSSQKNANFSQVKIWRFENEAPG